MKAKMDEIWAIYRRNLSQNNHWNINLPLKINFGRWIKNLEQSDRWITILPLESHLSCRINTGVIWAVRSRYMKKGEYRRFFGNLPPINHWYIGDLLPLEAIFSQNCRFISPSRYIVDILVIFAEISLIRFFSTKYRVDPSRYTIYHRYILTFSSLLIP